MEKRVYSIKEISEIFGMSRVAAYRLAKQGQLPGAFRLGGRVLVSVERIEKLLQAENETPGVLANLLKGRALLANARRRGLIIPGTPKPGPAKLVAAMSSRKQN